MPEMEDNTMEKREFLPLGTIVRLNGNTKRLIIVGRGLMVKQPGGIRFFDYAGVPYPEGVHDDKMGYFNHEAISKVIFEGFKDEEDQVIVDSINAFLEKAEAEQDQKEG